MKKKFTNLAYPNADKFGFGESLYPVKCGLGIEIGKGRVIPEIKYTLPPMGITKDTLDSVIKEYATMVKSILQKAVDLYQEDIILELEHPFEFTLNPEWGGIITEETKKTMKEFHSKYGLKSALRVTVADIRERKRPPFMRKGEELERMLEAFTVSAKRGADILSIESTGGKEVFDKAVVECDVAGMIFSVGVLGSLDMSSLWQNIYDISSRNNVIPGGDTDCCHSNTAMRLANMNYIPHVFASMVRAIGAVRSLVAFEEGAVGPHKDCGYEGIITKIITGMPISMEGKSSACAHSSHLGNVAACACDLWSNEAVQNVKLLGGFAPEVFTEILIYDCRLMNESIKENKMLEFRNMLAKSDIEKNPQALIIAPEGAFRIANAIIKEADIYKRSIKAAMEAVNIMKEAYNKKKLSLSARELQWLDRIMGELEQLPKDEKLLLSEMYSRYKEFFIPAEYGLTI